MRIDQIELTGSLSISSSLAASPLRVNKTYLFVSNTGNVGIGTNNPTSKLAVTGSASIRGGIKATTASGSFTFNESICSLDTKTAFKLPVGTTTERPATPTTGSMRYNTTTSALEIHLSGRWQKVSVSDYLVSSIEYLVIAGGGGGGTINAGGGGAGGYRSSVVGESSGGGISAENTFNALVSSQYTITVGAGGAAVSDGTNSIFATITSLYGGAGRNTIGNSGGSGGGGGGGANAGGGGTFSQGYAGGSGALVSGQNPGGGGGGGGGVGANGANNQAGNGGSGVSSSIIGSSVSRAGGGGGGTQGGSAGTASAGGGNGGGFNTNGTAGSVNTGGGGGGSGGFNPTVGGQGGSGVVIIRYPNTFGNLIIGSGLTYRDSSGNNQSGGGVAVAPSFTPTGYKVYQFNGGTGNIQFQL